ncbi:hypothetical protein [Bdellovibrio bacteriovorus]|uniref:hypothetical protein n=1 Tax=Bdellovibrio TaxID=958 RepID=UPI0035A8D92F
MKTKNLLMSLLMLGFFGNVHAAESKDKVAAIISENVVNAELEIEQNTFVWNVNGYACQLPGLRIPKVWFDFNEQLKHDDLFGTDDQYRAIGLKNPNFKFCIDHADAEKAFGKEFIPGAKLPMKITVKREIRIGERYDSAGKLVKIRVLVETTTVEVNNRELESVAEVNLQ